MCQPWLRWKVGGCVAGCVAVRLQVFTSVVCVSPEFTRISKLTWVVPEVCGCVVVRVCDMWLRVAWSLTHDTPAYHSAATASRRCDACGSPPTCAVRP